MIRFVPNVDSTSSVARREAWRVVVMPCLMLKEMPRVLDHDFVFHDVKFGG